MILRIVSGRVRPGQIRNLANAFLTTALPRARLIPGLTRYHVGLRADTDSHDVIGVTFWTTPEAAADALGGSLDGPRTLGDLSAFADFQPASHFEIDESVLRHSEGEAIALRVAIGRFSKPGSDREMQDLLRQRVPLIDDDMTEAYIGWRVDGRHVEVAFVSAWQRVSPDRPLDGPFWPDISTRYDDFLVQTYVPIAIVAGDVPA